MLNYPQNMTYKESRVERNLLPLEYRRKISDLVFFLSPRSASFASTDLRKFLRTLNQVIEVETMTLIIVT